MNPSATAALSPDPQAEPFGRPASSLGRRVRVAIIGLALAGAAGVAFWATRDSAPAEGAASHAHGAAGGTGDADVGLTTIFSDDLLAMTNKNQIRRANGSVRNVLAIPTATSKASRPVASATRVGMIAES